MVYIRGNRRDYDEWGVPGWAAADLLPYFLKAEDNERGASRWHGVGGPLPVSEGRSGNVMSRAFVEAGVQAGSAPATRTSTATQQDGVGMYQVTQRGGMRASAAVAYLHPGDGAREPDRDALHARRSGCCSRARARSACRPASSGRSQELRAEREVILCGGAYNSPQLLMLSGIGPAEHLTMREIEVLLDQPAVGENLSDHAAAYGVWTTPEPESLLLALEPAALEEYEADADRAVRLEPRRGGRLRPRRAGRARARHPVPRRAGADRRRGHERPRGPRRAGSRPACSRRTAAAPCGWPPKIRPRSRSSTTPSTRPATTCSG